MPYPSPHRHAKREASTRATCVETQMVTMWAKPSSLADLNVDPVTLYYLDYSKDRGRGSQRRHNERRRPKTPRELERDRMWSEAFHDHELAETVALGNYLLMEIFRGVVLAQSTKHRDPHI